MFWQRETSDSNGVFFLPRRVISLPVMFYESCFIRLISLLLLVSFCWASQSHCVTWWMELQKWKGKRGGKNWCICSNKDVRPYGRLRNERNIEEYVHRGVQGVLPWASASRRLHCMRGSEGSVMLTPKSKSPNCTIKKWGKSEWLSFTPWSLLDKVQLGVGARWTRGTHFQITSHHLLMSLVSFALYLLLSFNRRNISTLRRHPIGGSDSQFLRLADYGSWFPPIVRRILTFTAKEVQKC